MSIPHSPRLSLRAECAEDEAFLLALYESAHGEALRMLPLADEQRRNLMEMQFRAQNAHYRRQFPDASFDIVLCEGEPVGRLCVWRGESEVRIVDVALTAAMRGQGIGTALLAHILQEAGETGRAVRLHVGMGNRARGWYERLGFAVEGEEVGAWKMVWRPA